MIEAPLYTQLHNIITHKNECFAFILRLPWINRSFLNFPAAGVQLVVGHPCDPDVLLPEERAAGGQAGRRRQQARAGEESRRRRRRRVTG